MSTNGRFVWYDLLTTNPKTAAAFYTEAIGWKTQDWQGDTPYVMWAVGDDPVGGMMELPEEARSQGVPSHWTGYVTTPNLEDALKTATELGGQVLKGVTAISETSAFAVVTDPQGAIMGLYAGEDDKEVEFAPEVGHMSWHELMAADWQEAWNFYAGMFGWSKGEAMDMGEMGVYQIIERNGRQIGGMMTKPPDMPAPPHWLYYTRVDNIDAAVERIQKHGGKVLNGPMEVPGGGRIAQCMDPLGAAFAIHQSAAS